MIVSNAVKIGVRRVYRNDGAILESVSYRSLNELVGVVIDVGGGFVHDQNSTATENGARQTNELTLTHRKIGSACQKGELTFNTLNSHSQWTAVHSPKSRSEQCLVTYFHRCFTNHRPTDSKMHEYFRLGRKANLLQIQTRAPSQRFRARTLVSPSDGLLLGSATTRHPRTDRMDRGSYAMYRRINTDPKRR